jgi:hypothetical protein
MPFLRPTLVPWFEVDDDMLMLHRRTPPVADMMETVTAAAAAPGPSADARRVDAPWEKGADWVVTRTERRGGCTRLLRSDGAHGDWKLHSCIWSPLSEWRKLLLE